MRLAVIATAHTQTSVELTLQDLFLVTLVICFIPAPFKNTSIEYFQSLGYEVIIYTQANLKDIIAEYGEIGIVIYNTTKQKSMIESAWTDLGSKVIIVDEKANRSFQSSLIINPLYASQYLDYVVPSNCSIYSGHRYSLIREEFSSKQPIEIRKNVTDIYIELGEIQSNRVTRESDYQL